MNRSPRLAHLLKSRFLLLGMGLLAVAPLRADLNSDLKFTAFSNVDVTALAGGLVLQQRGPLLSFQRGITAQTLFIINAAPTAVSQKLITWNPQTHAELKVWIHRALPASPTAADFRDLASLPDNSSVGYLITGTAKLDPDKPALLMSKAEAQAIKPLQGQNLDKKALFVNFWSQLLAGRAQAMLQGKLDSGVYSTSDGDVRSAGEVLSLLRCDPKVYGDFHPLLASSAIFASNKIAPARLYYDCFDVEGYGALGTGAIFQAVSGTALQSVDCEYYVNSSIYTTIELEKMWPIAVNGKNETLVWREDLVSTPDVTSLHGVERLASSMLMLQDVKQGVDAFRAEFK
jgi:hypothetical protein